MLISHRKKFIFTKTAKTAGTSVEVYFEKYCLPEGEWEFAHSRESYVGDSGVVGFRGSDVNGQLWYNHMSSKQIKAQIGDEIWNGYFKFTIVRNPFDKMLSKFYMEKRFFEKNKDEKQGFLKRLLSAQRKNFMLDKKLSDIEKFRIWVKSSRFIDRDKYMIDDKVCVDFFIKYEELEVGMKQVCERLGVEFNEQEIPQLKKGQRQTEFSIAEFYDDKSKAIVEKLYKFELDYFNYSLEDLRA